MDYKGPTGILKKYINSTPLLSKPELDEELFAMAITTVLVREEGKTQKPVYYISKI